MSTLRMSLVCSLMVFQHALAQAPQRPAAAPGMPVRGGTVAVKVADYSAARRLVLNSAAAQGAELLDARTDVNEKGRKSGWMRFRLSARRLQAFVPAVHQVGKLYAENLTTQDRASEYEELASRVTRLRQHEARLSGVLQSGRNLRGSDILYVQERIFRAGVDEGMLLQRRVDIERAARASTITVQLFEPETQPEERRSRVNLVRWFQNSMLHAYGSLNRLLARGATALAYLVVYAPLWAVALLVLVLVWRRSVALRNLLGKASANARRRLVPTDAPSVQP